MKKVLVLGGGPDAEREVSLVSARSVAAALRRSGRFEVVEQTIDRPGVAELRSWSGDVVFPVLHGSFGEGGPMQDLLEQDGRPYVGCGPRAARTAMDKVATKMAAATLGIPTAPMAILNGRDPVCPLETPVVVKPVHDGSSVGLHICKDDAAWHKAHAQASDDIRDKPGRAYLVERYIKGRELTAGILDGAALPLINIVPAQGAYDYQAKYHRDDTQYRVDPDLPEGVTERVKKHAAALFRALGCRHLARVDFILDDSGTAWLLEINTMPGFTDHSLLPMAAARTGAPMPELCARLVEMAIRDHAPRRAAVA